MPFKFFKLTALKAKAKKFSSLIDGKQKLEKPVKKYVCFQYLWTDPMYRRTIVAYGCKSNANKYFDKCTLNAEERAQIGAIYLVDGMLHKTVHISDCRLFVCDYRKLAKEDEEARKYFMVLNMKQGRSFKSLRVEENDGVFMLSCPLNAKDRLEAKTLDIFFIHKDGTLEKQTCEVVFSSKDREVCELYRSTHW